MWSGLLRTVSTGRVRASLFVDAACCLPVFILSMCLLLSLINQAGAEQQAYADMADRADTQVDIIAASGLDIETDILFELARPGNGVLLKLIFRPFVGESSRIAESDDELRQEMMISALSCVANTCILCMQDLIGLDGSARMNIPSTVGNNWKWRASEEQITDKQFEFLGYYSKLYGRTDR